MLRYKLGKLVKNYKSSLIEIISPQMSILLNSHCNKITRYASNLATIPKDRHFARRSMLVKILSEELIQHIQDVFEAQLVHPVELIYFFDRHTCDTCADSEQLLDELSSISAKIKIHKIDVNDDLTSVKKYAMLLTPGLVVAGGGQAHPIDYGIRFFGIPSGYEFGSLIQAIILVSKRDSGLKPAVRKQLAELKKPVHIRVFVTPT